MEKMIKKEAKKTMENLNAVINRIRINRDNGDCLQDAITNFLQSRIIAKSYSKDEIKSIVLKNFRVLKRRDERKNYKENNADIQDYIDTIPDVNKSNKNDVLLKNIKKLISKKQMDVIEHFLAGELKGNDNQLRQVRKILKKISNYSFIAKKIQDLDFTQDYNYIPYIKKIVHVSTEERKKILEYKKATAKKKAASDIVIYAHEKTINQLIKRRDNLKIRLANITGKDVIERIPDKEHREDNKLQNASFVIKKDLHGLIPVKPERKKHNFSIASRSAHPAIYPDHKLGYQPCLSYPVINPYQGYAGIDSGYNPLRYVPAADGPSIRDIILRDVISCRINIVSDSAGHYLVRPVKPYGFWLPE